MTFKKENSLKMLYKVEKGVCDESFGLFVAELTHFPSNIIKLSKRKIQELNGHIEERKTKIVPIETVEYLKNFCRKDFE